MNPSTVSVSLFFALVLSACSTPPEGKKPEPEVTILGQAPPGMKPELLAPGVVSSEHLEGLAAFSPDLIEFYFLRQVAGSAAAYRVLRYEGGEWTDAAVETTSGPGEIFISTDGTTMHLGSEFRVRTAAGWSEKKSLGPAFEQYLIMRLTASAAGTYVFDERDEFGLLRYSRLIDGKREEPRAFDDDINSGRFTAHPFIAPDESYLIFDSQREDGHGSSDLYISFRQEDGSWGASINMGEDINTEYEDIFGSVTSDGKYFVYQTIDLDEPRSDIFWVDARVIETLRPKP